MVRVTLMSYLLLLLAWAPAQADSRYSARSEGMGFLVEQVADGLGVPWGLVFIARSEMLVTSKDGRLTRLNVETGRKVLIRGVPNVWAEGQGGLLDVALPPDFDSSRWVYFTYSKSQPAGTVTTLGRGRLQDNALVDWQDLVVTRSATDSSQHFGSRVVFDGKGHLFFGVGDRGHRPNGQDLTTHAGSLLRLRLDGSVPADNPFVKRSDALPEIWSYGHRNPQGMAYDRANDRLWEIEHGPRGGDEINLIQTGKNYGWPVISFGKEYWGPLQVGEGTHKPGMEQPVKVYDPSIAPGSLLLYTGEAFPHWRGNLFSGALKLQHLNRVVLEGTRAIKEERLLQPMNERIRALTQSPEGWIYFSTDSGKILRMRPAAGAQGHAKKVSSAMPTTVTTK